MKGMERKPKVWPSKGQRAVGSCRKCQGEGPRGGKKRQRNKGSEGGIMDNSPSCRADRNVDSSRHPTFSEVQWAGLVLQEESERD